MKTGGGVGNARTYLGSIRSGTVIEWRCSEYQFDGGLIGPAAIRSAM